MTPDRIRMSIGGEKLENVIGRTEDQELPQYETGAFELDAGEGFVDQRKLVDEEFLDHYVPVGAIYRHTMRDLIHSIRLIGSREFKCDQVLKLLFNLLIVGILVDSMIWFSRSVELISAINI